MATATTRLTAEQYLELPSRRWSELFDGVAVDVSPPNYEHGYEQLTIGLLLREAQGRGVGYACGELGCIIRRNPDTVRAPVLAFIKKERLGPSGRPPNPKAFFEGSPDLVVEIASPSDRPGEIQTKIREWMQAGATLVWVVYP